MSEKYEFTQHMREVLTKLDFEYFLKKIIEQKNYPEEKISELYQSKIDSIGKLKVELRKNKKQALFYLNGEIAKAVRGGMLPTHFNLSEIKEPAILDFKSYGRDWANFEIWKKYESRKLTGKKIWTWITKTGAILAIILSIIKLLEWFGAAKH